MLALWTRKGAGGSAKVTVSSQRPCDVHLAVCLASLSSTITFTVINPAT